MLSFLDIPLWYLFPLRSEQCLNFEKGWYKAPFLLLVSLQDNIGAMSVMTIEVQRQTDKNIKYKVSVIGKTQLGHRSRTDQGSSCTLPTVL